MRLLIYPVLVVVGLAVGVAGAFVHHLRLPVAGVPIPYGLVLALLTGVALAVAAGLLQRSRLGAGAVVVPWLLSALPFATQRPEGDLIIPGTPVGYAYLLATAVLGAVAVTLPYAELARRADGSTGRFARPEAGTRP